MWEIFSVIVTVAFLAFCFWCVVDMGLDLLRDPKDRR